MSVYTFVSGFIGSSIFLAYRTNATYNVKGMDLELSPNFLSMKSTHGCPKGTAHISTKLTSQWKEIQATDLLSKNFVFGLQPWGHWDEIDKFVSNCSCFKSVTAI